VQFQRTYTHDYFQDEAKRRYVALIDSMQNDTKSESVGSNVGSTAASAPAAAPAASATAGLRTFVDGKIFRIEFNRPDKYNAITWQVSISFYLYRLILFADVR
jgi:hypothetical protein